MICWLNPEISSFSWVNQPFCWVNPHFCSGISSFCVGGFPRDSIPAFVQILQLHLAASDFLQKSYVKEGDGCPNPRSKRRLVYGGLWMLMEVSYGC